MKTINFQEQEEIWQEQNKLPFQIDQEELEQDELDEDLNKLDDNEMWCPVCGCNMGIMDDECSVCGC